MLDLPTTVGIFAFAFLVCHCDIVDLFIIFFSRLDEAWDYGPLDCLAPLMVLITSVSILDHEIILDFVFDLLIFHSPDIGERGCWTLMLLQSFKWTCWT